MELHRLHASLQYPSHLHEFPNVKQIIFLFISHRFHSVCAQKHSQPMDDAIRLDMMLQDLLRAHVQAIPVSSVRGLVR